MSTPGTGKAGIMPSARIFAVLFLSLSATTSRGDDGLPPGAIARLGSTRLRHANGPNCLAVSPTGTWIATGGSDGEVRFWDATTGQNLGRHHLPDTVVTALAFSADGTHLFATAADHKVRIYSTNPFRLTGMESIPEFTDVAFSPDGEVMGGLIAQRRLRIRESLSGKPLWGHETEQLAAFAVRAGRFVVAEEDGTVRFWTYSETSANKLADFPTKAHASIAHLALSADGTLVAMAGSGPGSLVRIWRPSDGAVVGEWPGEGPVCFAANGAVVGRRNGNATIWKPGQTAPILAFDAPAVSQAVSLDGKTLAVAGSRGRVRVFDTISGAERVPSGFQLPEPVGVFPSLDGTALTLIAGRDIWKWTPGPAAAEKVGELATPATLAVFAAGRTVVATATGVAEIAGKTIPLPNSPKLLALSPDGRTLVSAREERISLNDLTTASLGPSWESLGAAQALAVDSTNRVAVVTRGGFLRYYDTSLSPPKELWYERVPRGQYSAVAISPDHQTVAVASILRLELFDTNLGKRLFAFDRGFEDGPFQAVSYSPDGRLIAAGASGHAGGTRRCTNSRPGL